MEATRRLCAALARAGVQHQVDGNAAIYIHMAARNGSFPSITRKVTILVDRSKVPDMLDAVKDAGFEMVEREIRVPSNKPFGGGVIHMASCSTEEMEGTPAVVSGLLVTSVGRLIRWKLENFHTEDKLHVQEMDDARLITPEIEAGLSEILRARLAEVRATE